jgi:hypothetical protein
VIRSLREKTLLFEKDDPLRRAGTLSVLTLALALTATSASAAATSEVVDGIGGGGGRIQARIAGDTASIVRGGVPWVFYGANPEYGYRLRLAVLGADPTYRTLDGAGGANGRTTDSVGTDVSATSNDGTVHVFYRDDTAGTLRHAWLTGGVWRFETIDGDSPEGGRTTNDVGGRSVALMYRSKLNVVYADDTAGDVRRAIFDGVGWRYSVLDGDSTAGGRTTDTVGVAIRAGVWSSRLHVLYTRAPGGLREATIHRGRDATYATISEIAGSSLGLLKMSDSEVYLAYDQGAGCCGDGPLAAFWDGASWSTDLFVAQVGRVDGITLFRDGGTAYLAAGVVECFGSGGCDLEVGVAPWNGSTFDDPYAGGGFAAGGIPEGVPSSAVTIGGVGHLFIGGIGFQSEPDIWDQVLMQVEGPF